jgi:excisionase family DNA binding protein
MEDQVKSQETEELLTRQEAAKLLQCNLVSLWRYTRAGKFPFYRAGKKMFFKRSEILESIKVG